MQARGRQSEARSMSRVLFCTERLSRLNCDGTIVLEMTPDPLECLSSAMNKSYDKIIIDLFTLDPVRRSLLFDLCRELKNNALTRGMEVIAILAGQDRPGLDKLYRTGIDRAVPLPVKSRRPDTADLDLPKVIADARKTQDLRAQICPLIGYEPGGGLASCGAHGNRLILGSDRLANMCCIKEHARCEFFLRHESSPGSGGAAHSGCKADICLPNSSRKAGPGNETQD